jgi:hypothetical protein
MDRDYRLSNNGTNDKIANSTLGMYESLAFDLHYYCSTLHKLSLPTYELIYMKDTNQRNLRDISIEGTVMNVGNR